VNINTIKKALPHAFNAKVVLLMNGIHGVGKSTAVREYCEEQDIGFVDLRLGQMEVGDLLGLPEITSDLAGSKVTVFARPKWFPTSGRGVLFLDEINRSKRDVIQAVFQLVLDRKIHDYVLPDGWQVVAAMNPNTVDYNTLDISDKAFLDRFCHIKVTSSYQDFLSYGDVKGFNKSVLRFISNHPGMLRADTADFSLDYVQPSDRSWEAVSRLTNMYDNGEMPEDIYNELVAGIVGTEASTALMADKKKAEKPIEGLMVLRSYPQVRQQILEQVKPDYYRPDLINDTKNQITAYLKNLKEGEELSTTEYDNLVAFGNDLTNDLFIDQVQTTFDNAAKVFLKLTDEAEDGGRWAAKVDALIVEQEAQPKEEPVDSEVKGKKAKKAKK
jgi:MoxR-like ATPase